MAGPFTIPIGIVFFYAVQLAASGYAIARGGAPERVVGAILLGAAIVSSWVTRTPGLDFNHLFWAVFWIDAALLFALTTVGLIADRFWPMWLASLQLVALANHGVRALDAEIVGYAYWLMAGKISYPMLAVLMAGTWRHVRRLRGDHPEHAWTHQRKSAWARSTMETPMT